MAARYAWKGTIALGGGLMPVHVEAHKATEKYAGNEPLKDLCQCHKLPLDRSHRDAATGKPRAEITVVKGVENPNGAGYVILSEAQVESIKAGLDKTSIEPLALLDAKAWASHTVSELFYLQPDRKQGDAAKVGVEGLYAYLAERDLILVARVVSGSQQIMAIHTVDGKLVANRLRYAQEIKDPEPAAVAVASAQIAPKALAMFDTLLEELPRDFDISTVGDATVARKQAAIQAALSGTPVEATEVGASEPTSKVPDLMAQLQAAIDAKGKKPATRKPKAPEPKAVKA